MSIQKYRLIGRRQKKTMNLDLLRSRHVLLGMFLGYVFNPPSLSCTSPTNGPSNGSKTVKTGQNSAQRSGRGLTAQAGASHLRPGPHISGRGLTIAECFFTHNSLLGHPIASPFFSNESYDSPLCPRSKKPTQLITKTISKTSKA